MKTEIFDVPEPDGDKRVVRMTCDGWRERLQMAWRGLRYGQIGQIIPLSTSTAVYKLAPRWTKRGGPAERSEEE